MTRSHQEVSSQMPAAEPVDADTAQQSLSPQGVLDALSDGFAILDQQWRFVYLNAAGAALVSQMAPGTGDVIGRDHWEVFPDTRGSELETAYRRAVELRTPVQFEVFHAKHKAWLEIRAYPQVEGLVIYFVDVTQRKHAQDNIGAEKNVLAQLAAGAPLDQLLDQACRDIQARSVDGMLCSVQVLDDSGTCLRSLAAPSLSDAYTRAIDGLPVGLDQGCCGSAAFLRETVTVPDINTDPRWERYRDVAIAEGLRACSSRPILSRNEELLGTISMYYRNPGLPSVRDRELVELAAQLASIAIERRTADTALQAAAERLRATFDQAAIGMAIAELDGHFVEMNDKFVALLGYSVDELRTMDFAAITHPEDLARTQQHLDRLLGGEIPEYTLEKRYVQKDGATVWSRSTITLLKDEQGRPRQFIGAVEDITHRKHAETALLQRENELRALADTMPQLVWIADQHGHIFWFNRGWYDYTGTTPEQMQDANGWHRVHDAEILPRVLEHWTQSLQSGEPFEMEFPLRGADGVLRAFLTRANPVRDERGEIMRWFGTNTELGSVDRARQALQDETRILDLVHTTGRALASQLDLDVLLQQVTDHATQLSGAQFGAFFYNATNEVGDVFQLFSLSGAPREAFEKFGHPRATALFGSTFRGGPPVRIDDVFVDTRYGHMAPHFGLPKGHPEVRSFLAVAVMSPSGEPIGGLFFGHHEVGVFTERTERIISGIAAQAAIAIDNARLYETVKRGVAEREALLAAEQSARADAEQANLMKDEFLATLSHELRTPLSAILGWSQILQGGLATPENLARGLDTIGRNARAQAKLIEDLLDMSRIVSGKVRLDVQPTDVKAVVEASVEAVRPSAQAKEIDLRVVIDPKAGPVAGDPNRLQQVVWNLLANAVKFTPRQGKIEVLVARVESHLEIRVADSGIGIHPDFLPLVFDRFRQADSSISRVHGGLGLGLAIVRQLTELHGGTVQAESPGEGQGATFVVRLPLTAWRSGTLRRSTDASHNESDAEPQVDLSHLSVLVVDDEPDTRVVVEQLLVQAGAKVATAANAADALACMRREPPDLLISDIGMPGTDGYALIRTVRRLPVAEGGQVPAVALTAFARSQDRTRALIAGYQAQVAKPFEAQELLATVASLVRRP
jgi:PAS domain S-box-containing protein